MSGLTDIVINSQQLVVTILVDCGHVSMERIELIVEGREELSDNVSYKSICPFHKHSFFQVREKSINFFPN